MKEFAADLLVGRLVDWGVDTVFGRPGDGDDGVLAAFDRLADRIRLVLVHHEEAAALMASGYAKTTGRVGVCLATSGPGALHLLAGLYDAKLDRQPVLAVTEAQATELLGTSFRQGLTLDKAYEDVADYNVRVDVPVQIPAVVDIGIGHALARGTVSHLTLAHDLEQTLVDSGPWALLTPANTPATAPVFVPEPGVPPAPDLKRAAGLLDRGSRVVVLAGAGALGARREVLAVAERLASPVVKSLPGKAVVADDSPLTTGCVGVLGTRPSEEALAAADTLLLVGTNYPYERNLPDPARVAVVQIETDLGRVGDREHTDVALAGDAAETLDALLPLLRAGRVGSFLAEVQAVMARWRGRLAELEDATADPVQPPYLLRVVDRLADGDTILAADSGTVATWAARHFDVRGGRDFLLSANLATAAAGLPYAIAAAWAHRGRQCVAVVGSDGFASLMAELGTAVQLRLPVKVVVCDTGFLAARLGGSGAPPADLARWAEACGCLGLRVERVADLQAAVAEAFRHPGPALVDVLVDAGRRPLPAVAGGA